MASKKQTAKKTDEEDKISIKRVRVCDVYKKGFKMYEFEGIYKEVLGTPSKGGIWILYGKDKNGKSWSALTLANYMRQFERVLYVSAEEGLDKPFIDAMKRAKIPANASNLKVTEYVPLEDLYVVLKKQRSAKFIVLDNMTVYDSELKKKQMLELKNAFPDKTFLIVAHEERNEPYTSGAMMAYKLAKIIMRVKGLTLFVSGRCPGGHLVIDEERAMLHHGTDILD